MKKIFALTITILMILGVFCSCTPKTQDKGSSQIANIENSDKGASSIVAENHNETSISLPSEQILKQLFDKSALYTGRSFHEERSYWVVQDFENLVIDSKTFYRADGTVTDYTGVGDFYWKTNYKYSDAKKFYAQTLSGPLLYKFMAYNFYDLDNVLAVKVGGGASGFPYENLEFTYIDYDSYHPYKFYYYTASYYLTQENRKEVVDFVIREGEDGYRVCVNDFFSGIKGWDLFMYIEP